MDQAHQQLSSPQGFEVKHGRALQFQTACNIGTLGTLVNKGARHSQRHCSAQQNEVRQGRNIRNGAAYLVRSKISAVKTIKAVSFAGFVGLCPRTRTKLVQSPPTCPQFHYATSCATGDSHFIYGARMKSRFAGTMGYSLRGTGQSYIKANQKPPSESWIKLPNSRAARRALK
eukprot:6213456-Pleurochrysis_carterae.AAC.3